MSYEKLGFVKGQTLKAEHLNHMEEGIANAGGASVQSDWNQTDENALDYIKNKPYYEKRTVMEGDTLYWDGNIDNRDNFEEYWWVSDAVPTMSDFANGVLLETTFVGSLSMPSDSIIDTGSGFITNEAFAVVYGDVEGLRKGTYLNAISPTEYISSLTIPGYTDFVSERVEIATIDPKFLPNALKNPDSQGAVSKWDILTVAKSQDFYLQVGETTYQELNDLWNNHAIYIIIYEDNIYIGLYMFASGHSGSSGTVGNVNIVAIDYNGLPCTIEIKTETASDWDSLNYAKVATVNVTNPLGGSALPA